MAVRESWHFRAAKEFATKGGSRAEFYAVDSGESVAQNHNHPGFAAYFYDRGSLGPAALIDFLKTKKPVSGYMPLRGARTSHTILVKPSGEIEIKAHIDRVSDPGTLRVIKSVLTVLQRHAPK